MVTLIRGKAVIAGKATGRALVTQEPLSFWGGYDHRTGEITDRRHPLSGQNAAGRILAVPFSRGSSTTTAVLLEAVRSGTAPVAIITTNDDAFFALASVVAREMYGRSIPVITVADDDFRLLETGQQLHLDDKGLIEVEY